MEIDGICKMVLARSESYASMLTQPDLTSTGRFRVVCFASSDLLKRSGQSSTTLTQLSSTIKIFPPGVVELIVLHPLKPDSFMWKDIPQAVKEHAEMSFYNGTELQDAYGVYGVSHEKGVVAVVRPDGYIGVIAALGDMERVIQYLGRCLKIVGQTNGQTNGKH